MGSNIKFSSFPLTINILGCECIVVNLKSKILVLMELKSDIILYGLTFSFLCKKF